jgi:hypothetical protein
VLHRVARPHTIFKRGGESVQAKLLITRELRTGELEVRLYGVTDDAENADFLGMESLLKAARNCWYDNGGQLPDTVSYQLYVQAPSRRLGDTEPKPHWDRRSLFSLADPKPSLELLPRPQLRVVRTRARG